MTVPVECTFESKEIQGMKEEVINKIRSSYREALQKPFDTGLKGRKIKECTTDEEEEVSVILPTDIDTAQILRAKACSIAEGYLNQSSTADGGEDDTFDLAPQYIIEENKLALYCGQVPLNILSVLQDRPAVIRDATNSYIEVKFKDLLRGAYLIELHNIDLRSRKWMLEELVHNTADESTLKSITWESEYSDVDTYGR